MFIDAKLQFSDAQTITTNSESGVGIVSANTINLGAAGLQIGTGEQLYVVVGVDTAMTSAGSNDPMSIYLITDDDSALGSPVVLQKLMTFPAVSAAGTMLFCPIAPGHTYLQYLGLKYMSDDGALTAGAFSAFIVKDIQAYTSYADAITIS